MDSNQQKVSWALLVVDCMKQLRTEGFRFADQEVIPNFDSTPNGNIRVVYLRGLLRKRRV